MKLVVLEIADNNLAGFSWRWSFSVERLPSGTFTLSAKQLVTEGRALALKPRKGLRDGVDLYEAMESMLSEAGYSLEESDLPAIMVNVAKVDTSVAEQFSQCPELRDEREVQKQQKLEAERQAALAPYRKAIDQYVLRFSDHPLRNAVGSQRFWMRRFIEDFALANGQLPSLTVSISSGVAICKAWQER
jgi:hypothetical protein